MIIRELPYAESTGTPPPLLPSYPQTFGNARNHQRRRTIGTIVLHIPALQLVMQRMRYKRARACPTLDVPFGNELSVGAENRNP